MLHRPLSSEDRALLWRFRWNLTGEKRALTKVLQSMDWADAQEARQGIDLLGHWAAIDVADALELLSPAFLNPEVSLLQTQASRTQGLGFLRACHAAMEHLLVHCFPSLCLERCSAECCPPS